MPVPKTRHFKFEGHRLAYAERGEGERVVVLLHGLLLSKRMHRALARELGRARTTACISLDLLGHGESDQPVDMTQHSMQLYGRRRSRCSTTSAIDQAVFLGTSLGANTTLEAAALAPERVRGMVIEMPVLDNAIVARRRRVPPGDDRDALRRAADQDQLRARSARADVAASGWSIRSGRLAAQRARARRSPCCRGCSSIASLRRRASGARSRRRRS